MKIVLPYKVKEKMRLYVESLDNEISGFGKISFEDDVITVEDIKIFKQEVTSGSSELEGEDIAKFITEMAQNNETLEGWNLWWHSHNDMSVFWSGTDTGTMEENPLDAQHMLSIVTNNKGEYKARLDVYEPTHMYIDDIDISIDLPKDNSLKKEIEKEVKKLVSQPKPKTVYARPYTKPQPPIIAGGHWDAIKKEWIEIDEIEEEAEKDIIDYTELYEQKLTDTQIKEEGKKMAEQFTIDELAESLQEAEYDQEMPYDTFAIIERAFDIKLEQAEIVKEKKVKKSKSSKKKSNDK